MKLLLTGVDGNLGGYAADILLTLEPKENLIYCGYNPERNYVKFRMVLGSLFLKFLYAL